MRTRDFVLTYGPGEGFERAAEVVRDWSRARLISMVLHKPGGGRVEMELLRDDGWLPSLPRVGGKYWLSMPEMGVEGACDLLGVEPCPPVPAGPGRMVTGTFRHTSGEVYDLQVAAESQPLGVTATHPFWSVDRHIWVSAIDLRIGEALKILTGTTHVVSMKKRPGSETVCNIEVEGDRCYRVGVCGILAHNVSTPGGGLPAHEAAGGHTIARHVGKTDSDLAARLVAQPGITGASTYPDEPTGDNATGDAITARSSEICSWLSGSAPRFVFTEPLERVVGRCLLRGALSAVEGRKVRVVLDRDGSLSTGYRVTTSFPVI